MHISGTEPSYVILSQTSNLKLKNNDRKVPKEADAKRDGLNNGPPTELSTHN